VSEVNETVYSFRLLEALRKGESFILQATGASCIPS
jgi:hypothetical protein